MTQVTEVFDSSNGGCSAATSHAETDCSLDSWSAPDTIITVLVAGREDGVLPPSQVTEVVVLLPLVKIFYSSSGGQDAATSPSVDGSTYGEEADRRAQERDVACRADVLPPSQVTEVRMLLPLVKIFTQVAEVRMLLPPPRWTARHMGRRQTDEHSVRLLVLKRVEPRMDLGRQRRGGRPHTIFDLCQVRSGNP